MELLLAGIPSNLDAEYQIDYITSTITKYFYLRFKMKFSDIMIYYDYNMTNIARACDITSQYVNKWKKKNKIPYHYQCVLELATKGELKADKKD